MSGAMTRLAILAACVAVVLLSLVHLGEANYKNAPMNGIMFGKRLGSGWYCTVLKKKSKSVLFSNDRHNL
jgi:hypothetical protein